MGVSREIRERIIARDGSCSGRFLGGACSPILDVHHILPESEGGTSDDKNLMTLCHSHHPMLEAIRRAILKRRAPARRRCRHNHRYPYARELCERRLNRGISRAA
jgi:HNH endonuclease